MILTHTQIKNRAKPLEPPASNGRPTPFGWETWGTCLNLWPFNDLFGKVGHYGADGAHLQAPLVRVKCEKAAKSWASNLQWMLKSYPAFPSTHSHSGEVTHRVKRNRFRSAAKFYLGDSRSCHYWAPCETHGSEMMLMVTVLRIKLGDSAKHLMEVPGRQQMLVTW